MAKTHFALDYDDTYTRTPELWDRFIANARDLGHEVFIVTFRGGNDLAEIKSSLKNVEIIATSAIGKRRYCDSIGLAIDVWIDDMPDFILDSECINV